jgi:hypothetical protein
MTERKAIDLYGLLQTPCSRSPVFFHQRSIPMGFNKFAISFLFHARLTSVRLQTFRISYAKGNKSIKEMTLVGLHSQRATYPSSEAAEHSLANFVWSDHYQPRLVAVWPPLPPPASTSQTSYRSPSVQIPALRLHGNMHLV